MRYRYTSMTMKIHAVTTQNNYILRNAKIFVKGCLNSNLAVQTSLQFDDFFDKEITIFFYLEDITKVGRAS